ncbi:MAG: hypothetical protein K6T85_12775 [Gorillibacterium sp.]|nr:hypothetical protein [Gorillibacterium sp.]
MKGYGVILFDQNKRKWLISSGVGSKSEYFLTREEAQVVLTRMNIEQDKFNAFLEDLLKPVRNHQNKKAPENAGE